MGFLPSLDENLVLFHVFKAYTKTTVPLLDFHEALLRGKGPLSEGERELIAAYVSALNGCRYCTGIHGVTAEALGIPKSVVQPLVDDFDTSGAGDKMAPLLDYVQKLTDKPDSLTAADADAVYAVGWDERALHDTVAICALFNFMNRYVEGLGIEGDEAYWPMAGERLAKEGYKGLKKVLGI